MKLEAETGDGEELPRLEAVSIGFFLWRICPIDRVSQILSPLGAPMHLWINISHIDPAAEAKANEFSMSQSRQFQTELLPGCRRSALPGLISFSVNIIICYLFINCAHIASLLIISNLDSKRIF